MLFSSKLSLKKDFSMIIVEGIDYVTLPVAKLETSIEFYSDLFDFELIEKKDGQYALITLDSYKIRLLQVSKFQNPFYDLQIPTISFLMDVDDFTEAISEIEEKKIAILKGPEANDKGEYLIFSDPDKNLIEISYIS
jgi:catechol 2,3-dioxygenase-like lactoylglutathione lyase family enzyme